MIPAQRFCSLSPYTTPGDYVSLYATLPADLDELCRLIKHQLIHPSAVKTFDETIPYGRKNEDGRFATVAQMLQELVARNLSGLVAGRLPQERLVVSCRHHALLLASILKSRGVPARVRVGFAEYVASQPGQKVDHWICEVWNATEAHWMLVDPDVQRVDFPRHEFEMAGQVWLGTRAGQLEPQQYGSPLRWGMTPIRDNLCHDFKAVLQHESNYGEGPPLFHASLAALAPPQLVLLDFMAEWLQNPDQHFEQLTHLRDRPELRS